MTGTLIFTVSILPEVSGTLTNTAPITSTTLDWNPTNNQAETVHSVETSFHRTYLPYVHKGGHYIYLPLILK